MGYNSTAVGRFVFNGLAEEKLELLNPDFLEDVVKNIAGGEWFYFQPSFKIEGTKIIAYTNCYGKLYELDEEIETVVSAIVKATGATSVSGNVMRTGEDPTDIEIYYIAQTTPTVRVESSKAESIVFRNGRTVSLM